MTFSQLSTTRRALINGSSLTECLVGAVLLMLCIMSTHTLIRSASLNYHQSSLYFQAATFAKVRGDNTTPPKQLNLTVERNSHFEIHVLSTQLAHKIWRYSWPMRPR
ncbi:MAG: hypothetical protein HWD83_01705 [Gammaproteobacteria bacterium]|nr:hypothetical protein [Gammaproteobacteria bacterium]